MAADGQIGRYVEAARALSEGPEPWIALRQRAAEALSASGLPSGRDEAWKYTRAASLLAAGYRPAEGPPVLPERIDVSDGDVVTVDGRILEMREPSGIAVRSIRQSDAVGRVLGRPCGFSALNLAMARDGAAVHVPAERSARLGVVHVATGQGHLGASRHLVVVEAGARLELVERFVGVGPAMTSAVVEVLLGEGAELVHVRCQDEGEELVHHGIVSVEVGAGARYHAASVLGGASVSRLELGVRLAGAGASAHLHGLALVRGAQHADHHVSVAHEAPGCTSRQAFRSLCDGRGRSVFTGNVSVRPGAVGTDAGQVHRALLLSDEAVANARPQLEILCDDVRCTHGVAVGALDEEQLFYLRQRGLAESEARKLLTTAFAAEIVAAVPEGDAREVLERRIAGWWEGR